eukprot:m.11672 g.11672  ORF g.11672 m.11672 type:complete len:274 (-) comp8919_c1_seq1:138-959(-)
MNVNVQHTLDPHPAYYTIMDVVTALTGAFKPQGSHKQGISEHRWGYYSSCQNQQNSLRTFRTSSSSVAATTIDNGSTAGPAAIPERRSKLLAMGIAFGVIGGSTMMFWPFLSPALRKHTLPYVPATTIQVENVIQALKHRAPTAVSRMVDLGSGDGRIVVAAAKAGYKGTGVELNHWLNIYARISAMRAGVGSDVQFLTTDLWKIDYKQYDAVVIFGVAEMMEELSAKLQTKLKPGSRIVACRFDIPDMEPVHVVGEGFDTTWVYEIPQPKLK